MIYLNAPRIKVPPERCEMESTERRRQTLSGGVHCTERGGIKNQLSCNNHKLVYESEEQQSHRVSRNLALPLEQHTHSSKYALEMPTLKIYRKRV